MVPEAVGDGAKLVGCGEYEIFATFIGDFFSAALEGDDENLLEGTASGSQLDFAFAFELIRDGSLGRDGAVPF